MLINLKIKKYKKKSIELHEKYDKLYEKIQCSDKTNESLKKQLINAEKERDYFDENVYSKEIFNYLVNKNKILVNKISKKEYEWNEIFDTNFSKIPKLDKYLLIDLFDEDGLYYIK